MNVIMCFHQYIRYEHTSTASFKNIYIHENTENQLINRFQNTNSIFAECQCSLFFSHFLSYHKFL